MEFLFFFKKTFLDRRNREDEHNLTRTEGLWWTYLNPDSSVTTYMYTVTSLLANRLINILTRPWTFGRTYKTI